jgi:hypothetical protein
MEPKMTTELEDQLAAGMAERTAGITLASDVLGAAKRQHNRRTAVLRGAYVAVALGIAGVVAVAVYPGSGRPPVANSPEVTAKSPALQLAAAAAASDNASYKLKINTRWVKGPGPLSDSSPLHGAFDPAAGTGYLINADGNLEERLINGTLYSRGTSDPSEPFYQLPGQFETIPVTRVLTNTGLQSADPQQLVQSLQQANATITQNASGAFHYSVTEPVLDRATSVSEGDITLDPNGRIAKVTWNNVTTLLDGFVIRGEVTIELSDYGMAVQVEMPTNVRS